MTGEYLTTMTVLAGACGLSWAALACTSRGQALLSGWHAMLGLQPGVHDPHTRASGPRRRLGRILRLATHPVTVLIAAALVAALVLGYHNGVLLAHYTAGCA